MLVVVASVGLVKEVKLTKVEVIKQIKSVLDTRVYPLQFEPELPIFRPIILRLVCSSYRNGGVDRAQTLLPF